jgi:hypothetical protein
LIYIYYKHNEKIKLSGLLITETESPYDGKKSSLTIESKRLTKEMTTGLFGYSFWLYINKDYNNKTLYRNDEWKSIFYRGSKLNDKSDISTLTQYVGVWLKPYNNSLAFVFQQNGVYTESVEITTPELNVWVHYYVAVSPNSVNIYKNGKLEVSSSIKQSPSSMDDYSLYLTADQVLGNNNLGGFDGFLTYLRYYNYTLSPTEVEKSYLINKNSKKSIKSLSYSINDDSN